LQKGVASAKAKAALIDHWRNASWIDGETVNDEALGNEAKIKEQCEKLNYPVERLDRNNEIPRRKVPKDFQDQCITKRCDASL